MPSSSRPVILCVDDELIVLQTLKLELRRVFGESYGIETAEHGSAALEMIAQLRAEGRDVPVMITDYMMPQMRGDELMPAVWDQSPRTQVIMLTAYSVHEDLVERFQGTPLGCIMPKPWLGEELVAAVRRAVETYTRQQMEETITTIESVATGIWSWDLRTNQVESNLHHAQLLGYDRLPEPLTMDAWASRVHPEDLPQVQAALSRAIAERTPYAHQYRVVCPTGELRWLSSHGRVVTDEKNQPIQVIGLEVDMTHIRCIAGRSPFFDREKVQFLSLLSHELRTPLSGVLSVAELLLTQPNLNQEHRAYVQLIQEGGNAMLELLNGALDLAKLTVGKLQLSPQNVEIAPLLTSLCQLFQPQANLKGLGLRPLIPSHAPETVVVDPQRLKQILSNLITNALKFTSQGAVLVSLKYHLTATRSELLFMVRDTGSGIPPDFIDRLFRPYEQADHAHYGTGLGLSICEQLVRLMGGNIWLESLGRVGGAPPRGWRQTWQVPERTGEPGTVVYFTLPTNMEFAAAKFPLTIQAIGHGADDSAHLLHRLNYSVVPLGQLPPEQRVDLLLCHRPLDAPTIAIALELKQRGTIVAICAEALSPPELACLHSLEPLLLLRCPLEAADFFHFLEQHLFFTNLALDLSYLYQTRQVLNLSLGEMLAMTLESTENAYTQLQQAIATQNSEGLRYWLHSLRNAVKLFGTQPLGSLCGVLESLARGQNFTPKKTHVETLQLEYTRFHRALIRELDRVRDAESGGSQNSGSG
ncbi:MAG: PAS domain-containing protein [Oscillatoriales cyanobacterium SM2_2_1]|nr:PAS domain-containing protein [Oscillatoriales cyanobacterium SM2_2_1]